MKFRKKPIVIEAEQYIHPAVNVDGVIPGIVSGCESICEDSPHIHTASGPRPVSIGTWIITDPDGVKYPCKPDKFDATYERVS